MVGHNLPPLIEIELTYVSENLGMYCITIDYAPASKEPLVK